MTRPIIAVVGATGVLGRQVLSALAAKDVEADQLRLFASERTAGEELDFGAETIPVEPVGPDAFRGVTAAVLATPAEVSRGMGARLEHSGAWVVDCSGAFLGDTKIPLVALGVNDGVLDRPFSGRIVALAHPVTLATLSVLEPLREKFGLATADVTVLGGASLYGAEGLLRLSRQTAQLMNGKDPDVDVFPHRLAFNVIPAVGELEGGLSQLERTLQLEAGRVLGPDAIATLSCTSLLLPLYHGVVLVLSVRLQRPAELDGVRAALSQSSALKLLDQPEANIYPMPMLTADDASVHVGRVRVREDRVQLVAAVDGALRAADAAAELVLELVER
jgi:aspartate-semialdehyde dehydrogenase